MDSPKTLDALPVGEIAQITSVDWSSLVSEEARRLRSLGLEEGAKVSVSHRGVFGGGDPLAIAVGRMTVALRRAHAVAFTIELEDAFETGTKDAGAGA